MTEYGSSYKRRKRPRLMSITADDVGDHVYVEVSIRPKSLQDDVANAQTAMNLVNGRLISRKDAGRQIMKWPHPERIAENVEIEELEQNNAEIQEIKQKALVNVWKDRNKELVKLAEEPPEGEKMVTMTQEEMAQAIEMAVQLKLAEQQGANIPQVLSQAMMGGAGAVDPAQAQAQMQQGLGGGLQQAVLPEQLQMTQAEMIPEPAQRSKTVAKQTKRRRAQNNPKRQKPMY